MGNPPRNRVRTRAERAVEEPTFWDSLARLARESLHIVFFVLLHWGTDWCIKATGQERAWWSFILTNGIALYAVVGILWIAGVELYTDCRLAVKTAKRRLG